MTGRTHGRFWKHFDALPAAIQKLAREKYALWQRDPFHQSLKFEERRNGICEGEIVAWLWIGTHAEYNRFRF